jgi:murein DD-endopeptidase MepM/ murein hydrolase activator NlpD
MSHKLGVYYAPEHSRQSDRDYIAALRPPVIRILDPDVQQISTMHTLAPNAVIAPRTWTIDDNNGAAVRDLMADPIGTGHKHANQYRTQFIQWHSEALQRNLPFPPADRMVFNAANEPNQGGTPDKIAAYNVAFVEMCKINGLRAAALCLGVGWPDNTGPDTPVNWKPYADAGLFDAIRRGNHWLELHEYHYKSGPHDGWRWLAGRHLQCPHDVPILLGEIGVDNYVDKARWDREGGNRGWQGNVDADAYAEMIEYHIRNSDQRVVAALPFITDFRNREWQSFDTGPAHAALLARKDRMVPQVAFAAAKPHEVRLPSVVSEGPTPAAPPAQPATVPALLHPVRDPNKRRISQHFGENPDAYARFHLAGHNGVDFACGAGAIIQAVDDGTIIETADDPSGYGLYCKVQHSWGESLYAHLSERDIERPNIPIKRGSVIGLSGWTGNVDPPGPLGAHLHFAMRVFPYTRGRPFNGFVDPLPYLDGTPTVVEVDVVTVIRQAAQEFGIDANLLLSQAWAESSFKRTAVSSAGAMGLLQIMPLTWAEWSAKIGAGGDPFDARQNARVGAAYLKWLLAQTQGNVTGALIAYGFGIGNWLNGKPVPDAWANYAAKIVHGRDLLKAVGL